jgi:hypothetical protein
MKKRNMVRLFAYIVIAVAAIGLMTGCPQPEEDDSVSIDERIDAFIADANAGNYDTMYTNMHPTAAQYNQAKAASYWSQSFQDSDHTLGTLNISGTIVTSTISSTTYGSNKPIRFTMLEDGSDVWMIKKLEIDADNDSNYSGTDPDFTFE